jgi:hypothetical protein
VTAVTFLLDLTGAKELVYAAFSPIAPTHALYNCARELEIF